jgi:hypothetical protein
MLRFAKAMFALILMTAAIEAVAETHLAQFVQNPCYIHAAAGIRVLVVHPDLVDRHDLIRFGSDVERWVQGECDDAWRHEWETSGSSPDFG